MSKGFGFMLRRINIFFLVSVMVVFTLAFPATATDLNLERSLQRDLAACRVVLIRIDQALAAGKSTDSQVEKLRELESSIRTGHQALLNRYGERARRLESLGSKAIARHAAMRQRYAAALDSFLQALAALPPQGPGREEIRRLREIIDTILPRQRTRIHGAAPYRRLALPAMPPVTTPSVVPAYRGGNADFGGADLDPGPETPVSPAIAELARSLDWNPVKMYEWVKNNVATEWYWGAMKGAEETLRQQSGNDADQASLLVALFRAAGYPARFVRGVIEFFPDLDAAREQTGLDDPAAVSRLFRAAGIPAEPVVAGGRIVNFRVGHVWAEVKIPYANYRGTALDDKGRAWVPLDTTLKPAGYTENEPSSALGDMDLSTVRDAYLAGPRPETPLEFLAGFINDRLTERGSTATYEDLLHARTINAEELKIIPDTLQFREIAVTGEYASLPEGLVHRARFRAEAPDGTVFFDQSLPLPALSNRAVVLTYEPETIEDQEIVHAHGGLDLTPLYLIRLRPLITVDGARKIMGRGGLAAGADLLLTVELIGPTTNGQTENTVTADYPTLIGLSGQQVVFPDPLPPEEKTGLRLLQERALSYIDQGNKAEEELAALLGGFPVRPLPTLVTMGGVLDVVSLLGSPQGYEWRGLYLDADLRAVEPIVTLAPGGSDPSLLFMNLAALHDSVLEHRVLEEGFGVAAVSTARLLALANSGGEPLARIDRDTIDDLLPSLALPDGIAADIADAVNRGELVTIPRTEQAWEDWAGYAWLRENPASGESGWMLSGAIAGGMTALNPARWPEGLYDLMTNPEVESSRDPSSAIEIMVVKGSEYLGGIAGRELDQPLSVVALDREGKRVRGVELRFTVRAGGGMLKSDAGPWQSAVTVTTNGQGIAEVFFLCGTSTSVNQNKALDQAGILQQVDETVVEVTSANGLRTAAPITVHTFPDAPDHLRVEGDGQTGAILTWVGPLRVYVEDQYNNPVSGQLVDFVMSEARAANPCSTLSNSDRLPGLLVGVDDPCMNTVPVYGECGSSTLTRPTLPKGGAVAQVILGGLGAAEYPVTVRSAGLEETVRLTSRPAGTCDPDDPPVAFLGVKGVLQTDVFGRSVDSGPVSTEEKFSTIPLAARMFMIREGEEVVDREISCFSGTDTCPVVRGTGEFSISTDFADASVTFAGQEGVHLGEGRFTLSWPLPATPGRETITVTGTAARTIRQTVNVCSSNSDCVLEEMVQPLDPAGYTMDVTAAAVTVPRTTEYIPVNEQGYVTMDHPVVSTIEPASYTAVTAQLVLREQRGSTPVDIGSFTRKTSGTDEVTFLRGFRFDQGATYTARVILNRGSEYMEIESPEVSLVPLTLELDADLDHDAIFSEDDPAESMAPGLVVPLNADDDDRDGVPDLFDGFDLDPNLPDDDVFGDGSSPLVDSDLVPVRLQLLPADMNEGTVVLEVVAGQEKIRILTDNTKEQGRSSILIDTTAPSLTVSEDPVSARVEWQLGGETTLDSLPSMLYVEGVGTSPEPGDIRLALKYRSPVGEEIDCDTLVLTVATVELKVDGNRDGEITFGQLRRPENSYTFWVNDDHDMEHREEGEWHEDDEEDRYELPLEQQDWFDDTIGRSGRSGLNGNKRDLEDFAMIQLRVPAWLRDDSAYTYSFSFTSVEEYEGSRPAINLFRAVDLRNLYLSDMEKANEQIREQKLLTVTSDGETPVPRELIYAEGAITPFLFEGRSQGAGDLRFQVKYDGQVVLETSVRLDLHDIRWFYDEYRVGLESGSTWQAKVAQTYEPVNVSGYQGMDGSNEYFLFVHGWNVTDALKKRWTETIFKRLWWLGYKGRVGLFNWPCLIRPDSDLLMVLFDPHNFNNSEYRAWQSANSLSQLLQELKTEGKYDLDILAHSQGNVVVGEALAKYPENAPKVDAYIATQAALSASFYDNSEPTKVSAISTTGFLGDSFLLAWHGLIDFEFKTPRIFGHYATGEDQASPYFSQVPHRVGTKVAAMSNFYNKFDYALKRDVFELNNAYRPEYGMRFVNCDDDVANKNYDIFDANCLVAGVESGERFVNKYLVDGDGYEPVLVTDILDIDNEMDRYKIFAYIVHSRKRALGTLDANGGGFQSNGNVNLNEAPIALDREHYSHSRQFRSNLVREKFYWGRVMEKVLQNNQNTGASETR
ncbi:MAG: hypothetical protein Kow0089_03290 [Desulfobulbaceae bacterium]